MRYLGIDVGDKRIGIAISDPSGVIATPYQVYNCVGPKKDLKYIAGLAREKDIGKIIVGLPRNMNGTLGIRAEKCQEFAAKLTRHTPAEVLMHDERLTTVGAEKMLISADVSRAKRKKVIDKLAAQLILQNYLDSINN